ncbi:hypothetical protein SKAU_G00002000 [Synaphobranchus kaupii]|uniref:Uncharacterized protein n=1 Tax=Synaphobranchus kaupii TaxID=118154 RepID=A0A9Q1JCI2_SYNKA|nr:hypothetical protein SKAU_G00002000 [Synaphobranchus kaupii]
MTGFAKPVWWTGLRDLKMLTFAHGAEQWGRLKDWLTWRKSTGKDSDPQPWAMLDGQCCENSSLGAVDWVEPGKSRARIQTRFFLEPPLPKQYTRQKEGRLRLLSAARLVQVHFSAKDPCMHMEQGIQHAVAIKRRRGFALIPLTLYFPWSLEREDASFSPAVPTLPVIPPQ